MPTNNRYVRGGHGRLIRTDNNQQPNPHDGSPQQQLFSPAVLNNNNQGHVPLTGFDQNSNNDEQITPRDDQGQQHPSSTWHPSSHIPSSTKTNPHGRGNRQGLLLPSDLVSVPDHHHQNNNNISIGELREDVARMQLPPTPTSLHRPSNNEVAPRTLFEQRDPSTHSEWTSVPYSSSQYGTNNSMDSQHYTSESTIHENEHNVSNQSHHHQRAGRFVNTQSQYNDRIERRLDGMVQQINNIITTVQQSNINNNESASADLSSIGNVSGATSRIGTVVSTNNNSHKQRSVQNCPPSNNANPNQRTQNRVSIDIMPKYTTYNGNEMVTSPVQLEVGDIVYWQYSQGMMVAVEVQETTPPTLVRRQPIYSIITCSSKQAHDVRHDDLFITMDQATTVDQNGLINANTSVLTATDRLDMHAIGGKVSPDHMQRWASMRAELFKFSNLQSSLDSLCLEGDSIIHIKAFHETLSTMFTSASKSANFSLPSLNELTPTIKLRDIILPPPSYRHFSLAKAFYELAARMIAARISKDSFTSEAPKAKTIILSVANGTMDGFDQIDHLYRENMPFLGAINFDIQDLIAQLVIVDGMSTVEFIALAQKIKLQLDLSGIVSEKNALLKQFLAQLMQSNLQALLAHKNHVFQQFRRNTGNIQDYTDESIQSISQYILSGNPPTTLTLTNRDSRSATDQDVNNPSAFAPTHHPNPSNPTFYKPKYAAMQKTHPDEDDATVHDDIDALNPTEEEKAAVDEMIKPFFAALSKSMDQTQKQTLYNDLYFAAMNQKRPRVQCEACLGNHDTDQCRARGPNFQDEQLRKRVEQVNAKYGDTPNRPPVPSTPPTASFGGRLSHRAMAIQQLVEHEANTTQVPKHDDSHELQYHSLQSSENIESVLGKISNELEQSVADNKLLVDPKFAILQLNDHESSSKITTNSETRDLADAMQVGDYSVYNEQVNC